MSRDNIEDAILSTFLSINDVNDNLSDLYKLNIDIFSTPFRKKIAKRINNIEDDAYGFLSYEIEDGCKGTQYEHDYSMMNSQLSLGVGFSKKYHYKLMKDDEVNDLC